MTDDKTWLEEEKMQIPKGWNIAVLAGLRFTSKNGHDVGQTGQTELGVNFLASLQLARHCTAFVGHWSSAVSALVFNSMCVQHAETVGVCPPACNMGGKGSYRNRR